MKKSPLLFPLFIFFATLIALGLGTWVGWHICGFHDGQRYSVFLKTYPTQEIAEQTWTTWVSTQGDGGASEITQLQSGEWIVTER